MDFPQALEDRAKTWANVTYGNDEGQSALFLVDTPHGPMVVKLWINEDGEDFDRYTLQTYPKAIDRISAGATASALAEWHDGYADSGAWEDEWEGDSDEELINHFERLTNDGAN